MFIFLCVWCQTFATFNASLRSLRRSLATNAYARPFSDFDHLPEDRLPAGDFFQNQTGFASARTTSSAESGLKSLVTRGVFGIERQFGEAT
jgi:hypothetical protein